MKNCMAITVLVGIIGGLIAPGTRGADFNGDGRDDVAVFRPSQGRWAIRNLTSFYLGQRGDIPVPVDLSGNGTDRAAVFRPSDGLWAVYRTTRVYYGEEGDVPLGTGGGNPAGGAYDYIVKAGDSADLVAALESDTFLSVFIPAGTYYIGEMINVDHVRRITGEATWPTIVYFNVSGYYLSIDVSHCLVEGITVRGGGQTSPSVRGNVYVNADYVSVRECVSTGSLGSGFEWSASAGYPSFIDCLANVTQDSAGAGFQGPSLDPTSSRLVNCAARDCAGQGFYFCDNLSNCYVDGYGETGNGFLYCHNISSSNAANCVSSGFRYCSRVSSCAADGGGAMEDGFNSCSYLSACVAENVTDKKYDNCVYACSESCH